MRPGFGVVEAITNWQSFQGDDMLSCHEPHRVSSTVHPQELTLTAMRASE